MTFIPNKHYTHEKFLNVCLQVQSASDTISGYSLYVIFKSKDGRLTLCEDHVTVKYEDINQWAEISFQE